MRFEKFKFKDTSRNIIEFTCEESKLANFYGKNPKAPQYLTPIFFKKEVLDKYYNKPSKYSVEDGALFYGTKWMIHIDNNQKNYVMVHLGDLGKLPYEEQKHWKLYNIIVEDGGISETSWKRNFEAKFCSPTKPALFFKAKLGISNRKWKEKFDWDLFKPLNKDDEHHLKSLRIPDNEQKEFDEVILSLNKIIIDSLNVKKMKEGLIFEEEDKSINILQKYLEQKHKVSFPDMVDFLKNLQNLRSSGSAHRKGKNNYAKAYKRFDKGDLAKTFENILINSIKMLNTLENKILNVEND